MLENHTDVSGKSSERVLHTAWLNSHYQTGLKTLLDTAVLEGVELEAARGLAERWQKVDEIPFDFGTPPHVGGGERAGRRASADL